MEQRVPASARTRQRVEALLKDGTTGDLQAELIQLGVRRLVEEALEAEAREALGRGLLSARQGAARRRLPQRLSPRTNAHWRGRD